LLVVLYIYILVLVGTVVDVGNVEYPVPLFPPDAATVLLKARFISATL